MKTESMLAEEAATDQANTPPAIGEIWPGQGGRYVGLAAADDDNPQGHLVLCDMTNDLDWKAAIEWAKTQSADGHTDLRLPTRFEAALIYANAQQHVDQSRWHWTSTQCSRNTAWVQDFGVGLQYGVGKGGTRRVRLVRRFVL